MHFFTVGIYKTVFIYDTYANWVISKRNTESDFRTSFRAKLGSVNKFPGRFGTINSFQVRLYMILFEFCKLKNVSEIVNRYR